MTAAPRRPTVLCFGEILWDFLPSGLFPGGAPFNVAYHLHQNGIDAWPVSAVGRDVLGDELLRRLAGWEIPTSAIQRSSNRTTGYVRATVGSLGDAHYEIITNVAWDRISAQPRTLALAAKSDALVFGSLAQRSSTNHTSLLQLLSALPVTAQRVFDVNLRPPFDNLVRVKRLARHATILKLNADEAARLAGGQPRSGLESKHARILAEELGCRLVVITAGQRGAGLLRGGPSGSWHWEPGRPVTVADTIGAGDSFLASLVANLLKGSTNDAETLAHACRLGEWVAAQPGATPRYSGFKRL